MAKQCYFCTNNVRKVSYRDAETLKNFIDLQAKILPKNKSGLCVKHQKKLELAVKRARFMALLPFVSR